MVRLMADQVGKEVIRHWLFFFLEQLLLSMSTMRVLAK